VTVDPGAIEPVDVPSWILDLDMFSTVPFPFEVESILEKAGDFAQRIYALFRWAVTKEFLVRYGVKYDRLKCLPSYDSTSAAGAMRQVGRPLIVGVMLFSCGTSGAYSVSSAQRSLGDQSTHHTTSTGQAASLRVPAGEAIAELRTLSGLTWSSWRADGC